MVYTIFLTVVLSFTYSFAAAPQAFFPRQVHAIANEYLSLATGGRVPVEVMPSLYALIQRLVATANMQLPPSSQLVMPDVYVYSVYDEEAYAGIRTLDTEFAGDEFLANAFVDVCSPEASVYWSSDGHYGLDIGGFILTRFTEEEIEALIAHEFGHIIRGDCKWSSQWSDWTVAAISFCSMISGPVWTLLSRSREYAADKIAVQLTGRPEQLISVLQKREDYRELLQPITDRASVGFWYKLIGGSHPVHKDRIAAIRKLASA